MDDNLRPCPEPNEIFLVNFTSWQQLFMTSRALSIRMSIRIWPIEAW